MLAAHDRSRVHLTCYADVARPDAMTARLAAAADRWVEVTGADDRSIAARILADGIDVLVVGAGLGGSGAAWEARFWGQNKKIVIAEKANIDRSGAVAQGLYAINCYMGTRWGENNPEDHVRYARIDLMGLVREDLLFDMARHVDSTVHQFEEWGLPIWKTELAPADFQVGADLAVRYGFMDAVPDLAAFVYSAP